MSLKVEISGLNTSDLPHLTAKESQEMLKRIRNGETELRETFLLGNMRLVLSIVQRYKGTKESADDLFQVGMLGLMKATDHFNVDLGVMFSTYAVPMVQGEIRRFIREGTAMKVGRNIRDVAYRALQAREKLEKESSKEASLTEISEELNLPIREVVASLDAIADPVSIYDSVYSDADDALLVVDQLTDGKGETELLNEITLKQAIDELPEKERLIIRLRYYSGHTQTEISDALRMSQAQVSRLEKCAIEHLKEAF